MNQPKRGGWLRVAAAIDRITNAIGRFTHWLVFVMVLIAAFNAVARYAGRFIGINLSSNAYLEAQWYLFSLIFLLGAAYALLTDAHVRVDVFFARFPERVRTWINIAGIVVLILPFCGFALWTAWPVVRNSWAIREVSADPGGLPRYPLKAMVLVCFALLALQGISELIKEITRLRGRAAPEHTEQPLEGV